MESLHWMKPLTTVLYSAETVRGHGKEINPISAAIARHMGIDITQEEKAARSQRGIAIIIHGPPLSGQS